MLELARENKIKAALAGLPGIVQFSGEPLRLYPPSECKQIRIRLPEKGILNLASLKLLGAECENLPPHKAQMSSRHVSSAEPARLLSGAAIHTDNELCPWWKVEFGRPVQIEEIQIWNRVGRWGARSYTLQVDIHDDAGGAVTYDHLSDRRLLSNIDRFAELCQVFVTHCYGLPADARNLFQTRLGEFAAQYRRIVTSVRGRILGESHAEKELADQRIVLMETLVAIVRSLREKLLVEILEKASPIFDWLLPRSGEAPTERNGKVELSALSCFFAATLAKQNSVQLQTIKDFDLLLADSAAVRDVENTVTEIYKETALTKSHLPIMFRAHGLSGSALLADPQSFVKSMKEVEVALAEIGYAAAICYGTFLGAVREKGFIRHDDDVDMAVALKREGETELVAELQQIVDKLKAIGVTASFQEGYQFLKIRAPKNKRLVDLFPIINKDEKTVRMYMQQLSIRDVDRSLVLPFASVELYGETFQAPATVDGFLSDRYGPDWQTPQRNIGPKTLAV